MTREWMLKRTCSLSPGQVGQAYGMLCAFVLAIGLAFAVRGIWFVIAFAVVEILVLACALLHYARHATDHEHIALTDGCLLIERTEAGALQQIRLDPYWTRIAIPSRKRSLITLESRGIKVEVGAFVCLKEREKVAQELRRALRGSSAMVP